MAIKLNEDPVFGSKDDSGGSERYIERLLSIADKQEKTREKVALRITFCLLASVVCPQLLFALLLWRGSLENFFALKELTETIIAPVAGIVGAVTGFYFGGKVKPPHE